MLRKATIVALTLIAITGTGLPLRPASAADTGAVSGVAFEDSDRDGVRDAGELPRSGDALYLYDAAGTAIATATTGADGSYRFDGLLAGGYRVAYTPTAWRSLRSSVVPTTSSPVEKPSAAVSVPGQPHDFGWRRIIRSTTTGSPISSYVGQEGVTVESYNDVVTAQDVYAALAQGRLAAEAPRVTVRLDLSSTTTTSAAVGASGGVYDSYSAVSTIGWGAWLDRGASVLAHEYGHAWSLYYAYLVQQDSSLTGYLRARGLDGDPRVGSSSDWYPREMVAEDYRLLLGSAAGREAAQANRDIPHASQVPGLFDYLTTTFEQGTGSTPTTPSPSSPTPSPSGAPESSPTPTPAPSPSPSPSAVTPSSSPEPSPSAQPVVSSSPSPVSATPSPTASTSTKVKGNGGTTCRRC